MSVWFCFPALIFSVSCMLLCHRKSGLNPPAGPASAAAAAHWAGINPGASSLASEWVHTPETEPRTKHPPASIRQQWTQKAFLWEVMLPSLTSQSCFHKGWFQLPNQLEKNLCPLSSSCYNHFPPSSPPFLLYHANFTCQWFCFSLHEGRGRLLWTTFSPKHIWNANIIKTNCQSQWQWKGLYLPNHYNLMPSLFLKKNLEKKVVFFLSKLCRLTSPPPPARAQTPVVMISVTESGNYWTILFTPLARSELTRT